jgi:hypothetical protein
MEAGTGAGEGRGGLRGVRVYTRQGVGASDARWGSAGCGGVGRVQGRMEGRLVQVGPPGRPGQGRVGQDGWVCGQGRAAS